MLAVDRDVKPRNMNFAKVEKRGGGGINREGAFIAINTVFNWRHNQLEWYNDKL